MTHAIQDTISTKTQVPAPPACLVAVTARIPPIAMGVKKWMGNNDSYRKITPVAKVVALNVVGASSGKMKTELTSRDVANALNPATSSRLGVSIAVPAESPTARDATKKSGPTPAGWKKPPWIWISFPAHPLIQPSIAPSVTTVTTWTPTESPASM